MAADKDHPSFVHRVAQSFVYVIGGNVVGKVVSFVAFLAALRLLSREDIGIANLVFAITLVIRSVTELSLGVAVVQAPSLSRRQLDALFWMSLGLTAGFYAVLFGAAPLVAWFYDAPVMAPLLRVQGIAIVLFSFFFIPRALLERDLRFGWVSIIENLPLLLSSGVLYWTAAHGHGIWAFAWAELTLRGTQLVLCQLACTYGPRSRPSLAAIREIGKMVRFGVYASASRLLYNFYTNADYFVVGKLFSKEILGIYTVAFRVISDPARTLAMSVNQVAYPSFARLQDEPERLRRYCFTIARMSLSLIGVLLVALAVFLEPLLVALGYEKYLPAVPIAQILAIVAAIKIVAPLIPQLLNAVGRARDNFLYSLACALVLPAGFVIGAQAGVIGVALAWLVGYPIVLSILLSFGAQTLELSLVTMIRRLFAGLAVVVPMAAIGIGVDSALARTAWPAAAVAAIGLGATLAVGAAVVYVRERDTLKLILKR